MTSRNRNRPTRLASQVAELSIAAPQVVAHRMGRIMKNGPHYSPADHKEFAGMVMEKQFAFVQSWWAMWAQALKIQHALWMGATPWSHAWMSVAEKGLKPVHAKAVSNARRLGRKARSA